MLKTSLIYLSKSEWIKHIVTNWRLARKISSRFIAGEKLEEAIEAIKNLNNLGIFATLDHLGEHTSNKTDADQATLSILEIIDSIESNHLQANISVKLSQIGLIIDEAICKQNLVRILSKAKEYGNFVRIDMEESNFIDKTLGVYFQMRDERFDNTGVVIQSSLYRSQSDIQQLINKSGKIRLCKGAYKEPPEIAYPKKEDVDKNYDHLTALIMDNALKNHNSLRNDEGKIPPILAVASHDVHRIEYAKEYAKKIGLPKRSIEFQMLFGIRRDLQEQSVKEGYPVRVYVPFGTQWYPYFVRRLAERPANLWFFVTNFFRK